MVIVLDSSFAMALAMDDEHVSGLDSLLSRMIQEHTVVPPLWEYEIANAMLSASRRGRMPADQLPHRLALLKSLPISVDMAVIELTVIRSLDLAKKHNLTVYDAAYLELGIRLQATIATLDQKLAGAATSEDLKVIGA
jgi:predicted nucleic acid-binding protein